jgi:hypothetical protein
MQLHVNDVHLDIRSPLTRIFFCPVLISEDKYQFVSKFKTPYIILNLHMDGSQFLPYVQNFCVCERKPQCVSPLGIRVSCKEILKILATGRRFFVMYFVEIYGMVICSIASIVTWLSLTT